jgi:hypothetical protein
VISQAEHFCFFERGAARDRKSKLKRLPSLQKCAQLEMNKSAPQMILKLERPIYQFAVDLIS